MSGPKNRQSLWLGALIVAVAGVIAALCAWWWYANMVQRPRAEEFVSPAFYQNRMLSATLLLQQQKFTVAVAPTLASLRLTALPDGTIFIANPDGMVSAEQSQALLAWVGKGNTLMLRPRRHESSDGELATPKPAAEKEKPAPDPVPGEEEEEDIADAPFIIEADPIGKRFGVRTTDMPKLERRCVAEGVAAPLEVTMPNRTLHKPRLSCLTPPGHAWPLELDNHGVVLDSLKAGAAAPLWSDDTGEGVRVYREGKGHVVLLASNFFDNEDLKRYDHAEALLALVRLNPRAAHFLIVTHVDVLPWYRALWNNFSLAIVSLALLLAALLWVAVRRFGPLLPGPHSERRSLVEHIDASAAWLWNAHGGRQLLIEATRDDALAALARRAPELAQLPQADKLRALSERTGIAVADLDAALYWLAGYTSQEFTLQIKTLQALRKHFDERYD